MLTWKAYLYAEATGRIPTIHEIAGDGYPLTYLTDIATWRKEVYFQYSHELAEQEDD